MPNLNDLTQDLLSKSHPDCFMALGKDIAWAQECYNTWQSANGKQK